MNLAVHDPWVSKVVPDSCHSKTPWRKEQPLRLEIAVGWEWYEYNGSLRSRCHVGCLLYYLPVVISDRNNGHKDKQSLKIVQRYGNEGTNIRQSWECAGNGGHPQCWWRNLVTNINESWSPGQAEFENSFALRKRVHSKGTNIRQSSVWEFTMMWNLVVVCIHWQMPIGLRMWIFQMSFERCSDKSTFRSHE